MISVRVGECDVDILPVVNGPESEADRVREAFGRYEAYGVSLGIEGVQALANRGSMEEGFEVSELDLVYAELMSRLTGTDAVFPSPAMCEIIDLTGGRLVALDMNEEEFTEMYCDTVSAWDFTREHRLAKKGLKKGFVSDSPEAFAKEWDTYVCSVKGYRKVSEARERHIAAQIRDTALYRKSLLAVIETERADGVAALLRSARCFLGSSFIIVDPNGTAYGPRRRRNAARCDMSRLRRIPCGRSPLLRNLRQTARTGVRFRPARTGIRRLED